MPRVEGFAVGRERLNALMGLVAPLVPRCGDRVAHQLVRAREAGATAEEMVEAMWVALIAGGSIVIPCLRRAYPLLADLEGAGDG